ncbi:MAG: VCBS repeat-containing protein [Planctomycetia bacterium]|nr:VCBS repeat-containing protein [Planctomycetia bacterium]
MFLGAVVAGCLAGEDAGSKVVARHASFEDFVKGTCGNSGANVYVSRKGRVEVINKWDLNKDGYVDVVIPNDHGMTEVADALIYWNGPSGFRSLMPELLKERPMTQLIFGLLDSDRRHFTRLPAFGGGRAIVADLNRDGFPDIVFCNYIHNYPGVRSAFVYWGGQDGYKPNRKTELPTNWASGVAAADLNGDGYLDLVFANNGTEPALEDISPACSSDAFIYWNSPTGFDASRLTPLKSGITYDVAVADFNGDGRPDIAFACPKAEKPGVKVFWGSEKNYADTRVEDVPVSGPISLQAGDANGDGIADLVVTAGDNALIFFGGPNGLATTPAVELSAPGARAASIADLNRDGSPDIAFAIPSRSGRKSTNSLVYWGSKNGFSPDRRVELPTLGAEGVAAADLNGDGHPDLVFANSGDGVTYDVNSYIYWGSPTGFAPYMRSELQGFGAVSVTVAELNGDGRPDILLVNRSSGVDYGKGVASNIFWGNPHNYYSTASMTSLPTQGPYGIVAADLDDDGYTDVLFTRTSDAGYGGAGNASTYLYRGGPDGFTTSRRSDIPVSSAYTVHAADLNRDGYLDLVFAGGEEGKPAGIILWGGPDDYTAERKTVLPLLQKRVGGHQIADLNRDGFLDLIFTAVYIGDMEIFWGGKDGYSTRNHEVFKVGAGMPTLADLNGDGQLDFILGGELDPQTKRNNGPTRIYWGRPDGRPEPKPAFELESHQAVSICIADLNRDGYLDMAQSNYKTDTTRSFPVFIYWGGKDGKYLNSRRAELPAESAAGLQTIDLNHDGYPDLVVHNHVKDGEHAQNSYIYWNGPQGFDPHRRTELPTLGPHFSQMIDPGNLYTRKLEEEYVSAPVALPAGPGNLRLAWKAEEPPGARLRMQLRYAATEKDLPTAKWTGPTGQDTAFEAHAATLISPPSGTKFMQYRALFTSVDGGEWPVLTEVEIGALR